MKQNFRLLLYVLLILVFISSACKKLGLCKDDKLSQNRVTYSGNSLRTDGFYFEDVNLSEEQYTSIIFLFNNGIYFGTGSYKTEKLDSMESDIAQINSALKTKTAWGIFTVSGNTIEIEHWRPEQAGCFRILRETGVISNDTTFVITRMEYLRKGKKERVETTNDTYRFRPLSVKPDSTTQYIN